MKKKLGTAVIFCLLLFLTSCGSKNEVYVKTFSFNGKKIDIFGQNNNSGYLTNSNINSQFIILKCNDSQKRIYRARFWPGPSWGVLAKGNKVIVNEDGASITGGKETIKINRRILGKCDQ